LPPATDAQLLRSAGLKQIDICDLALLLGSTSSFIGRLFYDGRYDVQVTVDRDRVILALRLGLQRVAEFDAKMTALQEKQDRIGRPRAKRPPTPWDLKAQVAARDCGYCRYCGKRMTREGLSYDHVVPVSRGGQEDVENLVQACRICNAKKAARLLEDTDMVLLPPGTTRAMLQKVKRFGVVRYVLPVAV
jgi:hypothetical protein